MKSQLNPAQIQALKNNQRNWDERAAIHYQDTNSFYRVDEFKNGADVLGPIESHELGEVAGLEILHLQCHIGLDTLSLARRGASVTGLDFSGKAIEIAQKLASETELPARFIEGDVHQVCDLVQSTFDVVYASWGVFCWIPNAKIWIKNAASLLKPGGRLYIADDHPMTGVLEETEDGKLQVTTNYRTLPGCFEKYETEHTYTGVETRLKNTTLYEWMHPVEEYMTGVIEAGLQLRFFHEHEQLPWQRYTFMQKDSETQLWKLPASSPQIPLAFSLMAQKSPDF